MKSVRYKTGDEVIEVIIRDTDGSKIQVWRNNIADSKRNGNLIKWLMEKWDMKFVFPNKSMLDIDNEFFKV